LLRVGDALDATELIEAARDACVPLTVVDVDAADVGDTWQDGARAVATDDQGGVWVRTDGGDATRFDSAGRPTHIVNGDT
jgi:hypothetical protein